MKHLGHMSLTKRTFLWRHEITKINGAAELHYVTGISVHVLLVLLQIFHSEAAGYPGHRYMVLVEQVLPDLFLLFVGESVYGLLAQ